MPKEKSELPKEGRLSSKVFYGIIASCFFLGLTASCMGGWTYLQGDLKPTSRGIWEDTSTQFLIPVCAMIGATFGGLTGVLLAAGYSTWTSQRTQH
jgi:hypothetical protein